MANTTTGRPGLAVLSFDGGGVRGYSSLLIVEALMCAIQREMKLETVLRPCEYFNIIGGTSSGGLNAILLGRLGMSAEQALEAYRRVAKLAFTPVPHFPFSPQGAYSGRNLKKAIQDELERHVIGDREAALAEEIRTSGDEASAKAIVAKRAENARDLLYYDPTACRTVVLAKTTTDVGARPTLFKSYATDPRWMSCKIWEIARATSAATTFFPSIKIGRDKIEFLDTALGNNNPCDTLFDEISREFPENNIYCMVSVGTGLQKAIELKNNRLSILRSLAKLATNSNAVHSAMAQRHGSNKPRVYWRFDEDAGLHDVELDNWDAMSKVAGHTSNYINKPEVQNEMNELASCIKVASGEGPNAEANNLHFEVPFPPNATFLLCRSNDVFEKLDAFYREHMESVRTTALYGMAGVGKTQTALSYAYRCRDKQSVFWLNADDLVTLQNGVKSMSDNLVIGSSQELRMEAFKRWLEGLPHRWLLIIDNVDEWEVTANLLPTKGCGGILFTTQTVELLSSDVIDDEGHEIKIMPEHDAILLFLMRLLASKRFPKNTLAHVVQDLKDNKINTNTEAKYHEARSLIQKVYGIYSYDILLTLTKEFQQLPLGLVHAAAYMSVAGSEMNIIDYLSRLRSQKRAESLKALFKFRGRRATHRRDLHSAWSISVRKVKGTQSDAVSLLKVFGFLGRPISESLVENALNSRSYWNGKLRLGLPPTTRESLSSLDFSPSGSHDLENCLRSLASLHLIERDVTQGTVQLHSLMQEWIRLQLPLQARAQYLHKALTVVAHQLPPIIYSHKDLDIPYRSRLSLVHAHRLAELSLQDVKYIKDLSQSVLFFLDAYLWDLDGGLLTAATKLLPADMNHTTPRLKWVRFLTSEAKLHHVFSIYQAHKTKEFDTESFSKLTHWISECSLGMHTPQADSREWISWAIISTRIIKELWLDQASITTVQEEKLTQLIETGRNVCLKNLLLQLENSLKEETVEAVSKAVVARAYAKLHKRSDRLKEQTELLDQYRNHAAYGLTCGLEEFVEYFKDFIEAHWQTLSRIKKDYVETFIQTLDACGAYDQLCELVWEYACHLLRNYHSLESVTSYWIGIAACMASYIRSHNIDPRKFIAYANWSMGTPNAKVDKLGKYFVDLLNNPGKMGDISLQIIGSTLKPSPEVFALFDNCYNDCHGSTDTDEEIVSSWRLKLKD